MTTTRKNSRLVMMVEHIPVDHVMTINIIYRILRRVIEITENNTITETQSYYAQMVYVNTHSHTDLHSDYSIK